MAFPQPGRMPTRDHYPTGRSGHRSIDKVLTRQNVAD